jgi:hypothetical protein
MSIRLFLYIKLPAEQFGFINFYKLVRMKADFMSLWLKHQNNQSTITNKLFIKFLITYYKHVRKFYYTYTATIFISWNFISSLNPSMPLAAFKLHQVQVTECQVVNCQTKSTAKHWTLLPMFSDPLALVWLYSYSGYAGVRGNEIADKRMHFLMYVGNYSHNAWNESFRNFPICSL